MTRGVQRSDCTLPPVRSTALKLSFPAATVGGPVAEYEIFAANAAGKSYTTRICAVGGLYPRKHANFAKPVNAMIPTNAIPEGAGTIRVTPLDSYGNRGRHIEASIVS